MSNFLFSKLFVSQKRKRLSIAKISRSGYNTNRQTLSIIFIKERSEIMEKSIIFFDVDGTLVVCEAKEYIPQSAIDAIHAAQKNGHLCYLCTGRSAAEIYPHITNVGFDGIIGAGGSYVQIGNQMLYHHTISGESLRDLTQFFEENGFDYYLESNDGLFASKNLVPRLEHILYGDWEHDPAAAAKKENGSDFIDALRPLDGKERGYNKVCFLEREGFPWEKIEEKFNDRFTIIRCTVPSFGENSGELTIPNSNKSYAIDTLIRHLRIDQKNTFAFGDGMNDAEMLRYVAHGIAMGNAKEGLKAIADEVTESQTEDGIANAMKRHGLC